MDKKYRSFEFPVLRAVFVVVSFMLAILDMLFLYKALQRIVGSIIGNTDQAGLFMIVAFIIATVANVTALLWGVENGRAMSKKSINKHTFGLFLAWAALGVGYFIIRLIDLGQSLEAAKVTGEEVNIAGHAIVMGFLAVSYVGTGTLIQSSARIIFDAELSALRNTKKKFERANEDLADSYADIKESIGILKGYNINYKTLDVQRRKCITSMIRTENATMSVIVGRMLAKHSDMNPKLANDILNEVIEERDDKWLERG